MQFVLLPLSMTDSFLMEKMAQYYKLVNWRCTTISPSQMGTNTGTVSPELQMTAPGRYGSSLPEFPVNGEK